MRYLLALALMLIPAVAVASPVISGSVTAGGNITITGSGFGSGPTVNLYDSFEGASWNPSSSASNAATVGAWSAQDGGFTTSTIGYDSDYKRDGSQSLRILNTAVDGGPRVNLPATNLDVFYSFWAYVPADKYWPGATSDTNFSPANWKIAWLKHNNNSGAGSSDMYLPVYLGQSGPPTYLSTVVSGNNSPVNTSFTTGIQRGEWFRLSGYVKGRTDGTGQVQLYELTSAGNPLKVNLSGINTIQGADSTHTTGPYYFNTFVLNGYARTGANDAVYYDDVYVATGSNALARVEIGNAATYTTCTALNVLPPSAWSDTEITAPANLAGISGTAYLYVFDASGQVNASGYPLTVSTPTTRSLNGRLSGRIR